MNSLFGPRKKAMPTKKNSPKPTSPAINDAAAPQNAASTDLHKRGPVRRAKARKSIAEFDETHYHAEIAHEAYMLWLERGCAHGGDFEDWTHAIEIVRQRRLA